MTSSELITIEERGPIMIVRLNRPPANALCLELALAFQESLATDALKKARALVLTGGGAFFSGGLDLRLVPTYSEREQREFLGILNRLIGALYAHPTPVVAAVNGHAIAGAMVLALAADYRVGPEGPARFGLTEARVGIPFPVVPMIIVRAELSPPDVRYTTLHAGLFGPEEARRRGILDELRPPEAVLERATEVARDMIGMPADGYRRIKHQFRQHAIAQIEEAIRTGADPMLESWLSRDAQDASAALLAKERDGRSR